MRKGSCYFHDHACSFRMNTHLTEVLCVRTQTDSDSAQEISRAYVRSGRRRDRNR